MGKKGLKPEDADLWARITRSIKPLAGRARLPEAERPQPAALSATQSAPGSRPAVKAKKTAPAALQPRRAPASRPPAAPQPAAHRPPPAGTLNRRERQRMARGKVQIEARLDLHGMGIEQAHAALRAFLIDARRQGRRTVLVITGKGASPHSRHTLHGHDFWHAPERAGKLRQLVPRWLGEAGLAEHVAGFQPAHPRHGGGGAFYIRLRRLRKG